MSHKLLAASAVLFCIVSHLDALKLPKYLKACSISDPNIDDCARKSAQNGLPAFINGDRKHKVPNLNPLSITYLSVNQGTQQVGLKITIKDADLWGLKETTIQNIDVDLERQQFTWYLHTPKVELISMYNVTGKILLLPIFGAGHCNITLINPIYTYNFKYTTEQRNGEEWMVPHKGVITYKLDRAHIKLENLFNGDKLLGTEMNKFLNENWQDAARELGPTIAEALSQVIDGILKNICETVPMKDIFMP